MRNLYYGLVLAGLLLLLCCVTLVRWLISEFQLSLLSVRRALRSQEWRKGAAMKVSPLALELVSLKGTANKAPFPTPGSAGNTP